MHKYHELLQLTAAHGRMHSDWSIARASNSHVASRRMGAFSRGKKGPGLGSELRFCNHHISQCPWCSIAVQPALNFFSCIVMIMTIVTHESPRQCSRLDAAGQHWIVALYQGLPQCVQLLIYSIPLTVCTPVWGCAPPWLTRLPSCRVEINGR